MIGATDGLRPLFLQKLKVSLPRIGLCAFLAMVAWRLESAIVSRESAWVELPSEASSQVNPRMFEVLSFGHLPLAVDWLWIKTLQDPALSHVAKGVHPPAYYDLGLATDVDPMFFLAYKVGAELLAVVRDDGAGARDLLEKGFRFQQSGLREVPEPHRSRIWSRPWEIPLLLAYVNLFELNDVPAATRYYREVAQIPGSPEYVQFLVKRLEKPEGQYDVGLKVLTVMISNSKDERVLQELEAKRQSLIVVRHLSQVRREFEAFARGRFPAQASRSTSWREYLRANAGAGRDPLGGAVDLDPSGRIVTTTPHQAVFGLE